MLLVAWLMLWIAGGQAVAPPPQRGLPPTQRQGATAPRGAVVPPPQIPLPQIQGATPGSKYICTEPLGAERDQNGPLRNTFCASISGVVVRANSNIGIANAHVTLGPRNGAALADSIQALTDANGRFNFPSVNPAYAPDGYYLTADAEGYQTMAYGQVGANAFGITIVVERGSHQTFTFRLNPYQTASGTVHTQDVQPVAAALMRAYRIRYTPIGRRLKIAKTGLTNDLGDFRLFGMEPGDYYVSASYSARARDLPLSGAILTPNLSNPDAGYVTEYYPAGVSAFEAAAFTMMPNEEKTNLNITLRESDRFKVHVSVFAAANSVPHHFSIAMLPAGSDLGDVLDYAVQGVDEKDNADFDVTDVGPGRYSLVAFDKSRILSEAVPITVDHDLIVKVPVYDPLDVPGVVVDENGNSVSGKWSARFVRTDPEVGQTIRVDVESGSFVVPDVGPGAYDVYVDGLPFGTYIKEVQFPVDDGQYGKFGRIHILPDRPKRILDADTQRWRSEPVVRVVLARSDAVVVGYVQGANSLERAEGVQIVLEPDRRESNPYAQREDRFVLGSTDSGGFFRFEGVPPGDYFAYGFEAIPPDIYFDPQFNDRMASRGVLVTARPGKAFELTYCAPRYVDRIYADLPIKPPADANCMQRVPKAETVGIAP